MPKEPVVSKADDPINQTGDASTNAEFKDLQRQIKILKDQVATALSQAKRATERVENLIELMSEASRICWVSLAEPPSQLNIRLNLDPYSFVVGAQVDYKSEEEWVNARMNTLMNLSTGTGVNFWTNPK